MESSTTLQTKLVIDLDEGGYSEDLQTLLRLEANTRQNIARVRVESTWEDDDAMDMTLLSNLFGCLAKLENLQQIHVNLGGGVTLPLGLLKDVLRQSPKLEMLCMDCVILACDNDSDGENFANVVRNHPSLNCVCLSDIEVQEQDTRSQDDDRHEMPTTTMQEQCLEPFLVALARDCPSMRVLELEEIPLSVAALTAVGSSSRLREVELWNIPAVGNHIQDFANAMIENDTLENLQICHCEVGPKGGECLTKMLLTSTSLTSVFLDIDWGNNIMFGKPIAEILKSNTTLRRLHLICRQERSNAAAEAYAELICPSLAMNTTLKRLTLEIRQNKTSRNDNSRLAAAFTEPLRETLTQNCTLQEFSLVGGRSMLPVVWRKDVAFYLNLNKVGRKQWKASFATSKDLVQTWIKHKHDLSTSFYLLSLYPHLLPQSKNI